MLETTFIGHQGWMFATANARILVDPLLVEPFGHNGGVGVLFPPRQLDIAAMPPVDAVIYTHEHEDHFNIPSVNRLSRDIPVYIPERSSSAMRDFLREAGFRVVALAAGASTPIADLRLTTFSPDHVRHDEQDEWDTLAFLVEDTKDGGSFFSPVDLTVSAAMEAELKQRGVAPGLWGYANNVMNMSFQEQPPHPAPAVQPIIARFFAEHKRRPAPPVASLMCGGGFSFTGARSWMNHLFFPLDSDELFTGLQANLPNERFMVPTPGVQIVTDRAGIRSKSDSTPWLDTAPRTSWPDRAYKPSLAPSSIVEPACGRATLRAGELDQLAARLSDFASFLYGSSLFRALYSLSAAAMPPNVKPAFAINAMSGEMDNVFEYDPADNRFVKLDKPVPISSYAAGMECFASDLLGFLEARLMPSALMFGRLLRWRTGGEAFGAAIDHAIWLYGHPLRRPAAYLDLYRSIYAGEPKDAATVQARRT